MLTKIANQMLFMQNFAYPPIEAQSKLNRSLIEAQSKVNRRSIEGQSKNVLIMSKICISYGDWSWSREVVSCSGRNFFNFTAIKTIKSVFMIMEKELQKETLDKFFRKEYEKLVNFIRKNLDDRFFEASPEDIVQDVVLGLMSKLEVNVRIENLTAYIYRSVKNKIIDYQKKKQRTVSIESFNDRKNENYLFNTIKDDPSAEEDEYSGIEPEMLKQAISQLRPDEQAVIIATEFENVTYEELSEEWDVPVGTLLSRKHRALSKLHRILLNNQMNNQK